MITDWITNSYGLPSDRRDTLPARVLNPDDIHFSAESFCAVAAFAWVFYDHALTLRDEVDLVWRQKIRYAAFLFFWVRYMGLLLVGALVVFYTPGHFPGFLATPAFAVVSPVSQFVLFWAVEIILQCRIHALYGSRRLAIFNAIVFCLELGTMVVLWFFAPLPRCMGAPADSANLCGSVPMYWVPALIFELWLAALAFRQLKFSWGGDLFTVVVHDSIKYFMLIAVVMIAQVTSSFYQVDGTVLSLLVASQTIGGSRLVLQLRKAYYEGPNNGTLAAHGVRRGISSLVDEYFYPAPSQIGN